MLLPHATRADNKGGAWHIKHPSTLRYTNSLAGTNYRAGHRTHGHSTWQANGGRIQPLVVSGQNQDEDVRSSDMK
jgi:hypothetical protein